MKTSILDLDLIKAYEETNFHVAHTPPFTMKIGVVCPGLAALHKAHNVQCSVFITACNPYSESLLPETNLERHLALARELTESGLIYISGVGQHPSGNWPGEDSYLVLDLSHEAAKKMGVRLQQNAVVWSSSDAVPQLTLLR